MNLAPARLLPLFALILLAACDGPSADQPKADRPAAPPAAESVAPPDTTASVSGAPVPFVNPTKVGRALGEQSPSPPGSRTR